MLAGVRIEAGQRQARPGSSQTDQAFLKQQQAVEHALGGDAVERRAQRHVPGQEHHPQGAGDGEHFKPRHGAPAPEEFRLPFDSLACEVQRLLAHRTGDQRAHASGKRQLVSHAQCGKRRTAALGLRLSHPEGSRVFTRKPAAHGPILGPIARRTDRDQFHLAQHARIPQRRQRDLRADSGRIPQRQRNRRLLHCLAA
jgi:hypothetical protein